MCSNTKENEMAMKIRYANYAEDGFVKDRLVDDGTTVETFLEQMRWS